MAGTSPIGATTGGRLGILRAAHAVPGSAVEQIGTLLDAFTDFAERLAAAGQSRPQ
jgi:hypothetical protein